jgi:hypothetical protein
MNLDSGKQLTPSTQETPAMVKARLHGTQYASMLNQRACLPSCKPPIAILRTHSTSSTRVRYCEGR